MGLNMTKKMLTDEEIDCNTNGILWFANRKFSMKETLFQLVVTVLGVEIMIKV